MIDALRELMAGHGMPDPPGEIVDYLHERIRFLKYSRKEFTFPAAKRRSTIAHAQALLEYASEPMQKVVPDRAQRRERLLALIDQLPRVVMLAAATPSLNVAPVVDRLRTCSETETDMAALLAAVGALRDPARTGRSNALYLPLIRGGAEAWARSGQTQWYAFDKFDKLTGPFPSFIRGLIKLAGLRIPSDAALHQHVARVVVAAKMEELERRADADSHS